MGMLLRGAFIGSVLGDLGLSDGLFGSQAFFIRLESAQMNFAASDTLYLALCR